MAEPSTEQQILGSLMKNPKLLLKTDKYQIETSDFDNPFYKYAFWAIANLAPTATSQLEPYEIEQWISSSPTAQSVYSEYSGKQLLIDMQGVSVGSFDVLYDRFVRENLINDMHREGYDTSRYYVENPLTDADYEIADKFANSKASDILEDMEKRLYKLKSKYTLNDTSEVKDIFDGLEEMLLELEENPEIGLPLQGEIFNHAVSGAIEGRLYIRSAPSGVGKTRNSVADACQLAFPVKYDWNRNKWVRHGFNEKILFIITEQSFHEIQKMVVAYLTNINEEIIKKSKCNPQQKKVIAQAIEIFKMYKDNFLIVRVPNPTISLVQQLIREQVALHDIRYVFYDYIFVSPSLLSEFKGVNLRNDEILLMFSDALKQLAVELDVFVMSSTQVNAKADNNENIRDEASIAGSRAIINKADMGCIMARPTREELASLDNIITEIGIEPNTVTDIFKNRAGEDVRVRIWSYTDLGTMTRKDLFVTDSSLRVVDTGYEKMVLETDNINEEEMNEMLKRLNGGK